MKLQKGAEEESVAASKISVLHVIRKQEAVIHRPCRFVPNIFTETSPYNARRDATGMRYRRNVLSLYLHIYIYTTIHKEMY